MALAPEPPKPRPPAEEKQATAPPQALAAHIEHLKRYPSEARSRGEQGVAKVRSITMGIC